MKLTCTTPPTVTTATSYSFSLDNAFGWAIFTVNDGTAEEMARIVGSRIAGDDS